MLRSTELSVFQLYISLFMIVEKPEKETHGTTFITPNNENTDYQQETIGNYIILFFTLL